VPKEINLGNEDNEDDGWVIVTLKESGATDATSARLDVFEWSSKLDEFNKANQGKPDHEYNAALVTLMQEAGLPKTSHALALEFRNRLWELARELLTQKKMTVESRSTTASGPAA
jgi:hypothetical protein